MGNAFSATIIVSIILTTIILVFSKDILLLLFGASSETIEYAKRYIDIYAMRKILFNYLGLNAFIIAQGFAKVSMQTILIEAILNIILDPILIFYFNMGVKGAALATIISQPVSAIWVLKFLFSKKNTLNLKVKYFRLEKKVILPSLIIGLSPFIMQNTESILAVVFNTSLLKYGKDLGVGTMTILTSVMQFSLLPLIGLTQGAQPIISYNYGAKNLKRVKATFILLLKVALAYSFSLWLFIMINPAIFAKIFTSDITLINMVVPSLRIFMSASFLFSIKIVCQQTFTALGNAKTSIFLAILGKIILLIPLIYILVIFMENKVNAVFIAEPISDTISVIIVSIVTYHSFKKIFKNIN